jgi:hypothetical protein
VWKAISPGIALTLHEVADAMIRCVSDGAPEQVLEVTDLQRLAAQN